MISGDTKIDRSHLAISSMCVPPSLEVNYTLSHSSLFLRPHSTSGCFQTGYVYKGQPKFDQSKSGTCPSGPPKGAEWFSVKVTVSTATPAGEAKVYLNGNLVVSWNPRYPIKNRGGVLVANGYKNVVYYKDFQIY